MGSLAQSGHDRIEAEVLNLSETAALLRVPEAAVSAAIEANHLPARLLGGEWRILKQSVIDWLRGDSHFANGADRTSLPETNGEDDWNRLFHLLEDRVVARVRSATRSPKPGSKEAVLRHFGVFQEDGDLEEQLLSLRALRKAGG